MYRYTDFLVFALTYDGTRSGAPSSSTRRTPPSGHRTGYVMVVAILPPCIMDEVDDELLLIVFRSSYGLNNFLLVLLIYMTLLYLRMSCVCVWLPGVRGRVCTLCACACACACVWDLGRACSLLLSLLTCSHSMVYAIRVHIYIYTYIYIGVCIYMPTHVNVYI